MGYDILQGFTQAEVTRLSGYSRQTIRALEQGTLLRVPRKLRIYLGLSQDTYDAWRMQLTRSHYRADVPILECASWREFCDYYAGSESGLSKEFCVPLNWIRREQWLETSWHLWNCWHGIGEAYVPLISEEEANKLLMLAAEFS